MAKSNSSFKKNDPRFASMQGENHSRYKHGMFGTSIYKIWTKMKVRCYQRTAKDYPRYGGRDIRMSEDWLTFENFYRDMGPTYKQGLTIERVDNLAGYSKLNCRWATQAEQARNKRNVVLYDFQGEKRTIPEIANIIGIKPKTLYSRLKILKWPLEKAVKV